MSNGTSNPQEGQKGQKILVFGAGGQIGSDLVPQLHSQGHSVVLVDRVAPEATHAYGTFRQYFSDQPDWKHWWHIIDATDAVAVAHLIREVRPTKVYHLAAMLSARCEEDPRACWRVNMLSFQNVLDALVAVAGEGYRPRMIWPSSIASFGCPFDQQPPYDAENEYPLLPRTLYGITKVTGELLGAYYAEKFRIDFRAVRFPGLLNTAEPGGGSSDFANAMFFTAARGHGKAVSFVGPEARIPFMHMADAVHAIRSLGDADEASLTRRTYNVAAFPSPSAGEIAESIARHVPGFEVVYEPDDRAKIVESWPREFDDTPARRDWGWAPKVDSLDALTRRLLDEFAALAKG